MLITFKSKSYANILMMGEVATKLLEMMDFGSSVPGAIEARDVATAACNLKQALAKIPAQVEAVDDNEEDRPPVSLHIRAIPLIELLEAAAAAREHVRWE